jgi:hypothetical protein
VREPDRRGRWRRRWGARRRARNGDHHVPPGHWSCSITSVGRPTSATPDGGSTIDRLAELAARPNVATRLDAMGRSSGHGRRSGERVLLAIVAPFGPGRCMLGSDLPIERPAAASNTCTAPTTSSSTATHRATASCCRTTARSTGTGPVIPTPLPRRQDRPGLQPDRDAAASRRIHRVGARSGVKLAAPCWPRPHPSGRTNGSCD